MEAAADKMDDFKTVAIAEERLRPEISRHHIAVQLHGDAIGLHAQGFDEGGESEWIWRFGEGTFFAVDLEFHGCGAGVWESMLYKFTTKRRAVLMWQRFKVGISINH